MLIILLYALLISLGINLLFFWIAFLFKSDKFTDSIYGITFLSMHILVFAFVENYSLAQIIIFILIVLWSIRITLFLQIRILKQKSDSRFDEIRNSFWKFLGFWLAQAIIAYLISFSSLLFMAFDQKDKKLNLSPIIIFACFAFFSLIFETIADIQKFKWNSLITNKGKFINKGLWKISRHPNYFGEICFWISITIFALTVHIGQNYNFYLFFGIISPTIITLTLIKFSGIPILERNCFKLFGKDENYQLYLNNVSCLVPFFGKKGYQTKWN